MKLLSKFIIGIAAGIVLFGLLTSVAESLLSAAVIVLICLWMLGISNRFKVLLNRLNS